MTAADESWGPSAFGGARPSTGSQIAEAFWKVALSLRRIQLYEHRNLQSIWIEWLQICLKPYGNNRMECKMSKNTLGGKEDLAGINGIESQQHLLQPADFQKDIDELREQLLEERDRHLRTLADFSNYRRRVEREGNKMAEAGKREIILPLLGVIDDLERALLWANDIDQQAMEGVRIIYRKLVALLEHQGVHPFDSVGKLFTPDLHEAVAVTEDEGVEPGTIIEELRKGYLWNNELLRPAQVRVAG
jgi:molecular chaperone GrpE